MQIYLDTANVDDISKGVATGCIAGVTTNPTIISRENKPLRQCIADIVSIDPQLTILIEAVSAATGDMVSESRELVKMADNVIIKLPMTANGLAAAKVLSQEGIRTTVTLVFSVNQAIAASCAGANHVAPFIGRLDDIGADGLQLVRSIKQLFRSHEVNTKVISASVRSPQSVCELFAAGSDVVTMPYGVFEKLLKHPLTESGLKKFDEDWRKVPEFV